ncbi:MAG TPA: SAM-dependent methyltransferase [Trebonia sp.]|jgi:hypothetical protein|nr:SAM-dependent methyltransferase [Trebonia sp.]
MAAGDGTDTVDEVGLFAQAVDTTRPNIARVYDYWLDGKDNFAADREEAERMLTVYPLLRERARENRLFLARVVTWLAAIAKTWPCWLRVPVSRSCCMNAGRGSS